MKLHENLFVFVLLLWLVASFMIHGSNHHEIRKPYIVYMGDLPGGSPSSTVADDHHNLLLDAIGDEKIARESKIYSYGKSFNGFAARLLPHEATKLSNEEGVVSVFRSRKQRVVTTRSWDFLGLDHHYSKRNPKIESNLIVAVLDTGIWIDSPSFNDEGYGPPPSKWKGKCVTGPNFTACNNKVIGANYFDLENVSQYPESSVADTEGHGSHTASTVAGSAVEGASLYGLAKGTARGGVPSARIAVYKVCWSIFCSEMDLLAGFDEAIADGVDLISVSIGSPPMDFFRDSQAIGAFHAMKKGILTSCAAGNDGPELSTVENVAPWIMTVAATAIDRRFVTAFKLGNGNKFTGRSINTFSPEKEMYSLTSGAKASNNGTPYQGNASACDPEAISQSKVKGKIVYCLKTYTDPYIKSLGGTGVIQLTRQQADYSSILLLPGVTIPSLSGKYIDLYINSTKNPKAVIYKSKTVRIDAPFVASFSSRGPQFISSNILKPDLSAPGIDILAAYTKLASLTGDMSDSRYSLFTVMSGTSMACPHATAAAAYVKSFHPDWSPAAVKSALMTTATPMKIKSKDAVLGSGAGQINPTKAVHPGLIYNISFNSYISFLCKEGYNSTTIGLLDGNKKHNCSKIKPAQGTDGLNYPTMHKQLSDPGSAIKAVFYRTVTHVGYGPSLYRANISSPDGLSVKVFPDTLNFVKLHETKTFKVVVKGIPMPEGIWIRSALLEWNDSKHIVRSNILIYRKLI